MSSSARWSVVTVHRLAIGPAGRVAPSVTTSQRARRIPPPTSPLHARVRPFDSPRYTCGCRAVNCLQLRQAIAGVALVTLDELGAALLGVALVALVELGVARSATAALVARNH